MGLDQVLEKSKESRQRSWRGGGEEVREKNVECREEVKEERRVMKLEKEVRTVESACGMGMRRFRTRLKEEF